MSDVGKSIESFTARNAVRAAAEVVMSHGLSNYPQQRKCVDVMRKKLNTVEAQFRDIQRTIDDVEAAAAEVVNELRNVAVKKCDGVAEKK